MRRVEQFLQNEGYIVRVISLKGGLPTTSAIEELGDQLTGLGEAPGTAVVFDCVWQLHIPLRTGRWWNVTSGSNPGWSPHVGKDWCVH